VGVSKLTLHPGRRLLASTLGFGPSYGLTLLSEAHSEEYLPKLAELIQAGKVKPIVEKVFPLEKTAYGPPSPESQLAYQSVVGLYACVMYDMLAHSCVTCLAWPLCGRRATKVGFWAALG
jgi:hypothetical protein